MEHPERYSSTEIEEMLLDPEVKETFELLDKTKSSLLSIPAPDVEKEWEKFRNTHCVSTEVPRLRPTGFFSLKMAASIAVGILSVTAVAAIMGIGVNRYKDRGAASLPSEEVTEAQTVATLPDSLDKMVEAEPEASATVVFDNEPLGAIITKIAGHYGYEATFSNDKTGSLRLYYRWNKALAVEDVEESLNNFQQIRLTIQGDTIKID